MLKVIEGDLTKPKILGPVFKGAKVAYLSTPTDKSESFQTQKSIHNFLLYKNVHN